MFRILLREVCQSPLKCGIEGIDTVSIIALTGQDDGSLLIFRKSHATFVIEGEPSECFAAFVTTKHFEKEGDRFFDSAMTALVPIDGTDKYYSPEDAENFDEIFGKNTGYVIDPEECMADNLGYLIAYGPEGPDGKGYPNPEIITAIEDILK